MQKLINGFHEFRTSVFPRERQLFHTLAHKQQPEVLFITCSDSRVVPHMITQSRPGDLFVCRTVGNQIPPASEMDEAVSSAIEYAVEALGVKDIVVCGHSDCGAMKALLKPERVAQLPATASWLRHAAAAKSMAASQNRDVTEDTLLRLLEEENVLVQMENLKTHASVASRLQDGSLQLHSWFYEIVSGDILTYSEESERFSPLAMAKTELGGAA
jgi:carbonic anhydrase